MPFFQSLPNIHTVQTWELSSPTLEWGHRATGYAPKTWLARFQLATKKDTGGDGLTGTGDGDKTCKVETGL